MIIDTHVHTGIFEDIDRIVNMSEEIVLEAMDLYNIDMAVVSNAAVELWPGCEGLVHVSHLAKERVEKPSDMVKVGDEIVVKSLGYDKRGRLNLSRKEALTDSQK